MTTKYVSPNNPPRIKSPDDAESATAASTGRFERTDNRSYVPSNEKASSVPKNKPEETGAANANSAAMATSAKKPSARRCEGVDGELRGGSGIKLELMRHDRT